VLDSCAKVYQLQQDQKKQKRPCQSNNNNDNNFDKYEHDVSCMMQDNSSNDSSKDWSMDSNNTVLSASSLRPGKIGWKMTLRVRVLHAKVRRMILRKSKLSTSMKDQGHPHQ